MEPGEREGMGAKEKGNEGREGEGVKGSPTFLQTERHLCIGLPSQTLESGLFNCFLSWFLPFLVLSSVYVLD